jgi:hypothetical protein
MPKPNITYYLGAGASCKSLPIVANMPNHIDRLINSLTSPELDRNREVIVIKQLLTAIKGESQRFNTVDTYARKLFLNENRMDLLNLKVALSICFLYWQLFDPDKSKEHKPSPNIDYRYISLISSFLQKEKGQLSIPTNIKFITWNYDIQLELALQYFTESKNRYVDIGDIQGQYNSIPYPLGTIANPSIVHLNGIAGVMPDVDRLENAADFLGGEYNNTAKFLELMISYYNANFKVQTKGLLDYFSYSWEENDVTKNSIQAASKILEETDILVIIGYSFPVFNREIDRKLLGNSRKFKVYYQDPNADKLALSNIFDIPVDKIFEEKRHEQFLLPHEF